MPHLPSATAFAAASLVVIDWCWLSSNTSRLQRDCPDSPLLLKELLVYIRSRALGDQRPRDQRSMTTISDHVISREYVISRDHEISDHVITADPMRLVHIR